MAVMVGQARRRAQLMHYINALVKRAKRHPECVWNRHREYIVSLYVTRRKTIQEVARILEIVRCFRATPRQYMSHLWKWGAEHQAAALRQRDLDDALDPLLARFPPQEEEETVLIFCAGTTELNVGTEAAAIEAARALPQQETEWERPPNTLAPFAPEPTPPHLLLARQEFSVYPDILNPLPPVKANLTIRQRSDLPGL